MAWAWKTRKKKLTGKNQPGPDFIGGGGLWDTLPQPGGGGDV